MKTNKMVCKSVITNGVDKQIWGIVIGEDENFYFVEFDDGISNSGFWRKDEIFAEI
jgi:hypothetical protein